MKTVFSSLGLLVLGTVLWNFTSKDLSATRPLDRRDLDKRSVQASLPKKTENQPKQNPLIATPSSEKESVVEETATDPEAFAALAEEQFETIAAFPGARALALDIRAALMDDPKAFNFSELTSGPDHTLREDYLQTMIPDPVLREKWIALMEIVAQSQSLASTD